MCFGFARRAAPPVHSVVDPWPATVFLFDARAVDASECCNCMAYLCFVKCVLYQASCVCMNECLACHIPVECRLKQLKNGLNQ
jgi:hypothetical protein